MVPSLLQSSLGAARTRCLFCHSFSSQIPRQVVAHCGLVLGFSGNLLFLYLMFAVGFY